MAGKNGSAAVEVAPNLVAKREGNMLWFGIDLTQDIGKTTKSGNAVVLAETSGFRGQEMVIGENTHTVSVYVNRHTTDRSPRQVKL